MSDKIQSNETNNLLYIGNALLTIWQDVGKLHTNEGNDAIRCAN